MLEELGVDLPGDVDSIPNWTEFQHRFIIYQAVSLSPGNDALPQVIQVLRRFCEDVIGKTHPAEAAGIISTLAFHASKLERMMKTGSV